MTSLDESDIKYTLTNKCKFKCKIQDVQPKKKLQNIRCNN